MEGQVNEKLGEFMDTPALLQDVQLLMQLGTAHLPKTAEYLRYLGTDSRIRIAVLDQIKADDQIKDKGRMAEDIRLAEVLGMNELPKTGAYLNYLRNEYRLPAAKKIPLKEAKPKHPSKLKTKIALAGTAAVIAGASLSGPGEAVTKSVGELLHGITTQASSDSGEAATTEQTVEIQPTQQPATDEKDSTSAAAPSPTPSPSPSPTASPSATSTKTPEPTPKPAPTAEKITIKGNLFQEFALSKYQEIQKNREQRKAEDPEYSSRIDEDLNQDRINILVLGGRQDDQLTDSIIMLSYHIPSNSMYLISIPRDLQSPEVLKVSHNPAASRINQAINFGGLGLARKAIENATGLSTDWNMQISFDVMTDMIDKTVGYVDVELDKSINDPEYPALKGNGFDPFSISAGKHRLDGATALKVARSRHSRTDYERSEDQRKIIMSFVKSLTEERNPLKVIQNLQAIESVLDQKTQDGSLKADFDPHMIADLTGHVGNLSKALLKGIISREDLHILKKPEMFSTGITSRNFVVGAGIEGVAINKIKGGNAYSANPRKDYWGPPREYLRNFLLQNADQGLPEEEVEIIIPPESRQ